MVIVLFMVKTAWFMSQILIYTGYCDLIGSATIAVFAQVPYTVVTMHKQVCKWIFVSNKLAIIVIVCS